ncbi:MAG TPA: polyprenyl synthetase family protein [Thermoanaerobaculia bacterium]|nr:polyprenyl synthetase family protein [Thermoanaerobaculia bacterium]
MSLSAPSSFTPAERPPASPPETPAPTGASGETATAPGSGSVSGGFGRLIDGFRERLDREIAAFLAEKRSSAGGTGGAGEGPGASWRQATLADPGDLVDGVARLMAQGGKRLRPALVYHTYRACGGCSESQVMPLALATEFLHTYLLIHDDIMDHAEVRRGQPAAHARFRDLHRAGGLRGDADDFGRSVAILLGDLAHTYAVELFTGVAVRPYPATPATPAGPSGPSALPAPPAPSASAPSVPLWLELNRCFSQMCEEVIGGQYLEFLLAHRGHPEPASALEPTPAQAVRESELLRVLRLKSGRYTAERPIQLGALLAGAPAELREELSRYGTAVGEAFQLQDDLLGLFGDPATVGKPVGDDLREGKFTLLIHHALVKGGAADRQLVAGALGDPNLTAAEVARVQAALERTGARRAVTAMIAERLGEARRALETLAPLLAPPAPLAPRAPEGLPGDPDAGASAASEGLRFLSGLLDFLWEREQ